MIGLLEIFSGFNMIFVFWGIGTILYFTFYYKVKQFEKKHGITIVTYSGSFNPNINNLKDLLKRSNDAPKKRKELIVFMLLLRTSQIFIFIMPFIIILTLFFLQFNP